MLFTRFKSIDFSIFNSNHSQTCRKKREELHPISFSLRTSDL
nr:MAG TPA: hypothetical protein [Caudoviricetes sp.]